MNWPICLLLILIILQLNNRPLHLLCILFKLVEFFIVGFFHISLPGATFMVNKDDYDDETKPRYMKYELYFTK